MTGTSTPKIKRGDRVEFDTATHGTLQGTVGTGSGKDHVNVYVILPGRPAGDSLRIRKASLRPVG